MKRLPFLAAILLALNAAPPAAKGQPAEKETAPPAMSARPPADVRRTPIVTAVGKVRASVVNISTERVVVRRALGSRFRVPHDDFFDRNFEDFFGGRIVERKKVNTPLGSGCFISADGLVVTNEHVVRRASNIRLSTDDGKTYEAVLLAADPTQDIALLRAKSDVPLHAIPMGESSDLMLGETVIALGNPYGFENSVTSGIISALNREINIGSGARAKRYGDLIQTSALINPGNSGGPLVNVLGELVGINVAVVDQAQGIGFAVPIDRARDVLASLLATPQVSEAWPGLQGVATDDRNGVRVAKITKKGPAERILAVDDVIFQTDGAPVRDPFDFFIRVVQHQPGDTLPLKFRRAGKPMDAVLKLGRLPVPSPKKILYDKFGIAAQNLTASLAKQLGASIDYGVLISEVWPEGPAVKAGLARGDILVQIGRQPVRNLRDASAALSAARAGASLFVVVVRKDVRGYTYVAVRQ